MPEHMLRAPKEAPACYGNARVRPLNTGCNTCRFNSRCADFVDRACLDRLHGIGTRQGRRTRAVWPAEAPLLAGMRPPMNRCSAGEALGDLWGSRTLRDLVCCHGYDCGTADLAEAAASAGLVTTDSAVELAVQAGLFHIWLSNRDMRGRFMASPRMTTVVWLSGAIARRALLWQGRPTAFVLRRHYEVLEALEGPVMSREALRRRGPRADTLYGVFSDVVASSRSSFPPESDEIPALSGGTILPRAA